jgi:histidine ammonia-lyase
VDDPLLLGSEPLTAAAVVEVARGRRVQLSDEARERMSETRAILERILARGDAVYGLSMGVGAMKTVAVREDAQHSFNRLLLRSHAVGHGPAVPDEWVRATMVVRAAGLALGAAGVRPVVADALCDALNAGFAPTVHRIGSVGQADLSQLAEIGVALSGQGAEGARLAQHGLEPLRVEPREAHAIVNSNAFSTGIACLGLDKARTALAALEISAALAYEAVLGNVDQLHRLVDRLRPYPGHLDAADHLRSLLYGGALATGTTGPQALQDPLAFKTAAQVQGAGRDAVAELERQLHVELASSGDSPIVLVEEDRAISTGNHDAAPLGLALDYARLGLAQAATVAGERVQKLLTARFTGLPSGLRADPDAPEDGLGIFGHGAASLTAEIRLLAAPTMLELPTSGIAEGIEDRVSLVPVGAGRLLEQAKLIPRLAAVELVCAAQAIDLRGRAGELAAGTARAYEATRRHVPFTAAGQPPSHDLDELTARLQSAARSGPAPVPAPDPAVVARLGKDPVIDRARLSEVAAAGRPLTPDECMERARRAAALLDVRALERAGSGEAVLLWRNDSSEAWLNLWWEPRDTGYHDHDGSCVGVHVIEGRAYNEALSVGQPRRVHEYRAGDSFAFGGRGIHRMDHEPGAVTVHVYSPPIRSLGHYELEDGALVRQAGDPDAPSPPSDSLLAAIAAEALNDSRTSDQPSASAASAPNTADSRRSRSSATPSPAE